VKPGAGRLELSSDDSNLLLPFAPALQASQGAWRITPAFWKLAHRLPFRRTVLGDRWNRQL